MGITTYMFKLSESRGKEASGIAVRLDKSISVFKEPVSASKLVKSEKYRNLFESEIAKQHKDGLLKSPLVILGHSRLQTNGLSEINTNNQPVVKDGAVAIHNGIIVNDAELWKSFPQLRKEYDVDTEVFLSLLQMFRSQEASLADAARDVFWHMEGSASIATIFDDTDTVLLATNTGSLYTATSKTGKVLVFASEKYILQQIIKHKNIRRLFENSEAKQVKAGQGCLLNLETAKQHAFLLKTSDTEELLSTEPVPYKPIIELHDSGVDTTNHKEKCLLTEEIKESMLNTWESLYSGESKLTRCTRCLLPETMPFISFDEEGVCNYCKDYEHRGTFLKGEDALAEAVSKYRSASGEPDCIVGFSGGRDSAYGLDYIQNKLGLHPTTFTYDWGMVNDLARRNQARVVGKLGIEHIVISADIKRKRENIHKNLKAWLKKPDLGMVPILMAGDKQFYYYFHKVRRQTGVKLFIFCGGYEGEEGTGLFKYGFCNVSQGKKKALKRLTGISAINKLKIMGYYLGQFLRNPAYINKSMIDTLFAYYSTYVLRDDYLYLYHYLDWDEETILSTIKEKFNWESETDTIATWRIDDGTASFYNYIYLTMAGFTEFDIFRSHQIREGKLAREEAYELIVEENKPRFKSIEWYGQAIDFDMNKAIDIINKAPRLYETMPEKKEMPQELTLSLKECPELEKAPLIARAKQGLIA
jgi:glutamine---fructose-6-phosphate transaminase (isomerizing)